MKLLYKLMIGSMEEVVWELNRRGLDAIVLNITPTQVQRTCHVLFRATDYGQYLQYCEAFGVTPMLPSEYFSQPTNQKESA